MYCRRLFTFGIALLLALAGSGNVNALPPIDPPAITPFYDAPAPLPQAPGTLIRWEVIDNPKNDAQLYRILYTSTDIDGNLIAVSGTLGIPAGPAPADGFPLIASAHGMVGAAQNCAPSLALFEEIDDQSFWSMQLEPYLNDGYAVVLPDYQGAGTAGPASNIVGTVEAHDVLDAVRAARTFPDAIISDETYLWGHSQGGHAALFTNAAAASYAPDITFEATAVLAPAIDLRGIFENIFASDEPVRSSILPLMVARAWTDTYPELAPGDILTNLGEEIVNNTVDHLCIPWVAAPSLIHSPKTLFQSNALTTWAETIADNTPGEQPARPPLFIGHGIADEVIPIAGSQHYAEALCAAGNSVQFETYPDTTHFGVVAVATQDVLDFFDDVRSEGTAPGNCGSFS